MTISELLKEYWPILVFIAMSIVGFIVFRAETKKDVSNLKIKVDGMGDDFSKALKEIEKNRREDSNRDESRRRLDEDRQERRNEIINKKFDNVTELINQVLIKTSSHKSGD